MGTSLAWQTDAQLHDAVQRQLEWEPEIDAHHIAVTASNGVITRALRPGQWLARAEQRDAREEAERNIART